MMRKQVLAFSGLLMIQVVSAQTDSASLLKEVTKRLNNNVSVSSILSDPKYPSIHPATSFRNEIEKHVSDAGRKPGAKICPELIASIFQPQHEQEQQDANFCANVNKVGREIEGRQSAFAKGKPSQQVERDCRKTPSTGESRKEGKADDCQA